MKKLLKSLGILLLLFIVGIGVYCIANHENLPEGTTGKDADTLAHKMLKAMHYEAYKNTEVLSWSFRNSHHYKWQKNENIVEVSWDNNKVILHTKETDKSSVFVDGKKIIQPDLISKATDFFNNDSFWLIAPYKIFDSGTERRIVKHNGKDALLVTYTAGGTTPGDSYLWILDNNYFPTSFKMWTKIIPIGGVAATWSDWKTTKAGIQLPTKHTLSLFGLEISMGAVKANNPEADQLANQILKAINHDAYKNTRFLEWSFAGYRDYKWDKEKHIVNVSWDTIRVNLHPNNLKKSSLFFNEKLQKTTDTLLIKKAERFFNNDSFWLVAPHKLFDDGSIRSIKTIDHQKALRIQYTKGGTTPGDTYLWILDNNYVPKSFKMYVPSMKINGVTATWQDWITTESGALLPTNHAMGSNRILSMGTVKGYN